jgi:hypothetical protein
VLVPSRLGAKRRELIRWGPNEVYDPNVRFKQAIETLTRILVAAPQPAEGADAASGGNQDPGGVEASDTGHARAPAPPVAEAGKEEGRPMDEGGEDPRARQVGNGVDRPRPGRGPARQLKLDLE